LLRFIIHVALLENYHQYLQGQQTDSSKLHGSINYKPQDNNIQEVLKTCNHLFPAFQCLCIDFSEQGEGQVIESLTTTLINLDKILQHVDAVQVDSLKVSLPIRSSYFVEIAKIRALKILWTNLLQAYGAKLKPLTIDAHINPQAYDENPNTNMIRSMTIAMSAVIGGVSTLTVLPAGEDTSAIRIALNLK